MDQDSKKLLNDWDVPQESIQNFQGKYLFYLFKLTSENEFDKIYVKMRILISLVENGNISHSTHEL